MRIGRLRDVRMPDILVHGAKDSRYRPGIIIGSWGVQEAPNCLDSGKVRSWLLRGRQLLLTLPASEAKPLRLPTEVEYQLALGRGHCDSIRI